MRHSLTDRPLTEPEPEDYLLRLDAQIARSTNTVTRKMLEADRARELRRRLGTLAACHCEHGAAEHGSHASGARPCRHFGCGCGDYDERPW